MYILEDILKWFALNDRVRVSFIFEALTLSYSFFAFYSVLVMKKSA